MAPRKVLPTDNNAQSSEDIKPRRGLRQHNEVAKDISNQSPAKKVVKSKAVAAAKPKKAAAGKGSKLPDPIKPGVIFVDSSKKEWKVGKSLGTGGFGEVYSATNDMTEKNIDNYKYVMKVEYSMGPLFVEQNFYLRCGKPEHIEAWKKEKKLKALGLPVIHAFKGQQAHDGNSYRFIVISRFGRDLQKLLEEHKQFSFQNVTAIGCCLVDALEYIHNSGYVHADIKPANILLGVDKGQALVNLVDFGLATKYKDASDNLKPHKPDKRTAHNGTLIYTSVMAHKGVTTTSRMCDIEILAYNLLHMCMGTLPWCPHEKTPEKVREMKEELLKDPTKFLKQHYKDPVPDAFVQLFKIISTSQFEQEPDYTKLKQLLIKSLEKMGLKYQEKLDFSQQNQANGDVKENGTSKTATKKETAAAKKKANTKQDKVDEESLKNVNRRKRVVHYQESDEFHDEEEEETKEVPMNGNVKKGGVKIKITKDRTNKKQNESDLEEEEETTKPKRNARGKKQVEDEDMPDQKGKKRKNAVGQPEDELNSTYTVNAPRVLNTPAMLEVMSKRAETTGQKKTAAATKSTLSEVPTPAMLEIINKQGAAPVAHKKTKK